MSTVAVVTPIYATPKNGRLALFRETLRSVTRQPSNPVHIVVDDDSVDDVDAFVKEYLRENPRARIRYLKRKKLPGDLNTSSNAINVGLDACISKSKDVFTSREAEDLRAVTFLHSDDLLTGASLDARLENLRDGYVLTHMGVMDYHGNLSGILRRAKGADPKLLLEARDRPPLNNHTIMWDISFLERLKVHVQERYGQDGIFDKRMTQCEDTDVTISSAEAAISNRSNTVYVPAVTVVYRVHPESIWNKGSGDEKAFHRRELYHKHFGIDPEDLGFKKYDFFHDVPWSLFTFLPEEVKMHLRPIRDRIKTFTIGSYTDIRRDIMECKS